MAVSAHVYVYSCVDYFDSVFFPDVIKFSLNDSRGLLGLYELHLPQWIPCSRCVEKRGIVLLGLTARCILTT